ncbi:hypothetical protein C8R44DRAFT_845349, partial [Mycena epipterygia]
MIPSFSSESSGLTLKRKKKESDLESIYSHFLKTIRQDPVFNDIGDEAWAAMSRKVLRENTELPELSKPFTEGQLFYQELFENDVPRIDLREDADPVEDDQVEYDPVADIHAVPPPKSDPYQEAADALQSSALWEGVKQHVVTANDMPCRTAIDMVVLTAIGLAQRLINQNEDVDHSLCERHSLHGPKCHVAGSDRKIGAWVVLHQKVDIPDQILRQGLSFHGTLDCILAVVAASKVRAEMKAPAFLSDELYGSELVDQIADSLATIKTTSTVNEHKAFSQVAAQGAALCVMTKRASVVNILTNGAQWKFVRVAKTSGINRVTRKTRSAQPQSEARKPFKAAQTRMLDVFRNLPVILRLLRLYRLPTNSKVWQLNNNNFYACTFQRKHATTQNPRA